MSIIALFEVSTKPYQVHTSALRARMGFVCILVQDAVRIFLAQDGINADLVFADHGLGVIFTTGRFVHQRRV